ncbi:FCD domain-containing protein [Pseudonocardiaceae bacterium YIM PH 21723]|nr:FCD domain-containing protein [Pseudonocardiaceae bacterium YIM PH 21723]
MIFGQPLGTADEHQIAEKVAGRLDASPDAVLEAWHQLDRNKEDGDGRSELAALVGAGRRQDFLAARSMVEMRLDQTPGMAGKVAVRSGPEIAPRLSRLVRQMADTEDMVQRQRLAIEFWMCVAEGTQSVMLSMMIKDMLPALEPFFPVLIGIAKLELSDLDPYREVVEAISMADGALAAKRTEELIAGSSAALIEILDDLATGSTDAD